MAPLQFLFLGTGTSTGLPLTPCLTLSHSYPEAFTSHVPRPTPPPQGTCAPPGHYDPAGPWPRNITCACCRSAVDPDVPEGWKNKRGNTSAIVRQKDHHGEWKNILVDCGKTFLEQARRFFPRWGVQTIDAVLLTHGHADAYFGLDDLREWCVRQQRAIPIYLDRPTYDIVAKSFPYLVDTSKASGGGDVPTLKWNIISEMDHFDVCGMPVRSFPVHHGIYFSDPPTKPAASSLFPSAQTPKRPEPHPLICLAFMFDNKVLYMGDVSEVPERTWEGLGVRKRRGSGSAREADTPLAKSRGGVLSRLIPGKHILPTPETTPPPTVSPKKEKDALPILTPSEANGNEESLGTGENPSNGAPHLPVFIVDALWPLRPHASHFSLSQALSTALEIKPSMTYTIGSTHPTTHFMWEEVCRSFNGLDGQRPDHPDAEISRGLVKRVKSDVQFNGADKLAERWAQHGGRIEPGWDGLVLQVEDDGGWKKVTEPLGFDRGAM